MLFLIKRSSIIDYNAHDATFLGFFQCPSPHFSICNFFSCVACIYGWMRDVEEHCVYTIASLFAMQNLWDQVNILRPPPKNTFRGGCVNLVLSGNFRSIRIGLTQRLANLIYIERWVG